MSFLRKLMLAFVALGLVACASQKEELSYEVYTGTGAIPVTSTIFYSGNKALLVDAQFTQKDARLVAEKIKSHNRTLEKIYISHGEGEFYFGLETLVNFFPRVQIIATQETVNQISRTADKRIDQWQNTLGRENPTKVIAPTIIKENTFDFAGYQFDIKETASIGIPGNYLWVPEKRLLVGSQFVFYQVHAPLMGISPSERTAWNTVLTQMYKLNPNVVIPGYTSVGVPMGLDALQYSRRYLTVFTQTLAKQRQSNSVIDSMKKFYPQARNANILELSVRSANNEINW